MTNSRRKGKVGELELAHLLTRLGVPARRGQQVKGTKDSPDIELMNHPLGKRLYVECKRRQSINLHKVVHQAAQEAGEDLIPAIMHRKNLEPWLVTMRLEDIIPILKAWSERGS